MKRSILLLGESLPMLPALLRSVFEHPRVGSFQVGFGPPLVRSSPALLEALGRIGSALEKLDVYLQHCVVEGKEAERLARLHRQQLVRRHGPIEAEALDRAAVDAIDLSLKLRPVETEENEGSAARGEARIILRLDDPAGARWSHAAQVAERLQVGGHGLVVEMRVEAEDYADWADWAQDWARLTGRAVISDAEMIPHAIVTREPPPSSSGN